MITAIIIVFIADTNEGEIAGILKNDGHGLYSVGFSQTRARYSNQLAFIRIDSMKRHAAPYTQYREWV